MHPFLQRVQEFIVREHLLDFSAPVIVGVSGGADSIALLHTLMRLGYKCIVCHCNFNLRGEESMRDRNFTREVARTWNLPFEEISFDTMSRVSEEKVSVEMACRQLRYEWFETKREEYCAQAIAVAHHQDDSVETLLLNLVRGTGIAGLTAMRPRNGYVVRPLLAVTRQEVETYLEDMGVGYVVDHTNLESIYVRNKIRLEVLPLLRHLNPSVDQSIFSTMLNLREVDKVYRDAIARQEQELLINRGSYIYISIAQLNELPSPQAFLFELLTSRGFVSTQIEETLSLCRGISGKQILSATHRVVKDREHLIITARADKDDQDTLAVIDTLQESGAVLNGRLTYRCVDNVDYRISRKAEYAGFDADKLAFPLHIRRWRTGDRFHPFGMCGSRKLSDYFSDKKYSLVDKEQALLLCSGDTILWILGERAADGFRITAETKRIIEFNYKK